MRKILLTVAYDGTNYKGYQKQLNPYKDTIESRLEKALQKLFKDPNLSCMGASRTDKGVHALGQRVVFDVESTIPAHKIPLAVLGLLPDDIVIVSAEDVPLDFHPRYHATKKTYEYCVINQKFKNPLERLYGTFIYGEFDIDKMNEAAKKFVGRKDFKAFCTDGGELEDTMREIYECFVVREGKRIVISVTGNGFLYHMVRTIAGNLIAVGQGKISVERIDEIFESGDRQQAWSTAEARGLVLKKIYYDDFDDIS